NVIEIGKTMQYNKTKRITNVLIVGQNYSAISTIIYILCNFLTKLKKNNDSYVYDKCIYKNVNLKYISDKNIFYYFFQNMEKETLVNSIMSEHTLTSMNDSAGVIDKRSNSSNNSDNNNNNSNGNNSNTSDSSDNSINSRSNIQQSTQKLKTVNYGEEHVELGLKNALHEEGITSKRMGTTFMTKSKLTSSIPTKKQNKRPMKQQKKTITESGDKYETLENKVFYSKEKKKELDENNNILVNYVKVKDTNLIERICNYTLKTNMYTLVNRENDDNINHTCFIFKPDNLHTISPYIFNNLYFVNVKKTVPYIYFLTYMVEQIKIYKNIKKKIIKIADELIVETINFFKKQKEVIKVIGKKNKNKITHCHFDVKQNKQNRDSVLCNQGITSVTNESNEFEINTSDNMLTSLTNKHMDNKNVKIIENYVTYDEYSSIDNSRAEVGGEKKRKKEKKASISDSNNKNNNSD
ncbi:hypothetical protein HEP_00471300, partial [Hepatocystis sp. ex Piliocolobus tephrosceles]